MESITNYRTFEDDKKSIDDKISLLERYILADDKEQFFNTLVFNSDTYLYMKLNDMLNNGKDIRTLLQGNLANYFADCENSLKLEILFKDLVNTIPKEKDAAKRKDMILRFNKEFLSLGFEYKKPADVKKSEGITSTNEITYNSALSADDMKRWSLEKEFETYFNTPPNQTPNLSMIKPSAYIFFDMHRLAEKNVDHFLNVLKSLPHYYNIKDFESLLEKYYKKKIEKQPSFQYPLGVFTKMGLIQLENLLAKIPALLKDLNFVNILFAKKFENHNAAGLTLDVRLNNLKNMLEWADQLPKDMIGLKYDILKETLNLSILNGIYDRALFDKFIAVPTYVPHYYSEVKREEFKKWTFNAGNWASVHNFKKSIWKNDEDLTKEFLEHSFKTTPYEEWTSIFSESWLKKLYYTYKLKQGEKFSNITDVFTEIELNTLRDKRELWVTPETKLQFNLNEEVKVQLQMKNVQNLRVSIFEIDTFNYYKKRNAKIDAQMNLAGVVPFWTFVTEYKNPPIVVFKETFSFDQITKANRGVFIVEFVGDGLSTRALIKKGNLNLVRDSSSEGHLFYILDEQNNICKGEAAQLKLGDKIYKADGTGKILVPYMNENFANNVIISFENLSEICNLNLTRTDVIFDAGLLFNEESLESGRTVSFILQPKLFAFNRLVSIALLKDIKVIVSSRNAQDVRHSKVLEDVKFNEGEDFVVDYLIPSKTCEIVIETKGSIYDKTSEKDVPLSCVKRITITRKEKLEVFYDLFLKQEKDGYKIRLLGKNGEPYPGYQIQTTLSSNYLGRAENFTLETDQNGEINLGPLNGIWTVAASIRTAPGEYKGISKSWTIDTLERFKNFPEDFDIVEGEDLCLPAYGASLTPEDYSLFRTDQVYDNIFENKFTSIQQEKELIYLSGLKEGYYVFYYNKLRDTKKIVLRVHKAKRWEVSSNYILKEKSMVKAMNQANYLTYTGLSKKENELELKVLSNEMDTVKVHLLAYNYFPDNIKTLIDSHKGNCLTEKAEITNFASNFNEYYSEKEISDELKYAIERKGRQTFMGNTLEKPSGLLKRHFNRKTKADREVLGNEKNYEKSYLTKSDDVVTRALSYVRYDRKGTTANFNLDLMTSFLQDRGSVVANATVDPDGQVTIDIGKFANLSTACIVIEDRHNCLCELISLETKEPVKKDMRLEASREANKVYLHERTVHLLQKGSTLTIKDLNNTQMTVVDNISYLLEILKLLSGKRTIDEWDFLKRWQTMDAEEQLKKYDRFISHELNLFAFFKDKEFFEMVIKAHIQNKNQKTFIDYFLLGNKEEMLKYLDPVNVHKLNIMEQALLIYGLKDTHRKQCEKVFALLKLFLETSVENQKTYNALFDSVLKSEQSKSDNDTADKLNTIATTFSTSTSVQGQPRVAIPNLKLKNVQFDFGPDDATIKENRGGVQSFRTMGVTDEHVERQYFYSNQDCLEVTKFWLDFIDHVLNDPKNPFLSSNFILSARSDTEMLAVASVLDLPFERVEYTSTNDQGGFKLTTKENSIIFCKEIKEKNDEKMELDMIISQQFFDIYDRIEKTKDGSDKLKKVSDFVIGKLYASRIAITNFSETKYDITLLSEIPQGSIPVKSLDYLNSNVMTLNPLSTQVSEFLFYFPAAGEYTCYPAAITKDGCLVSSAVIPKTVKVYKTMPKKELKTMKDILSVGKTEDILNFMRTQNIVDKNIFKFEDIYWLLKDEKFYQEVCSILEERFIYDNTVYSFAVFHGDISRMRTYLSRAFQGKRITIRELDIYFVKNELFDIDDFKFREYYPLINPRVHDIGEYKHNILNRDFMNTYITFLKYLLDKGKPGSKDYFYLAIYFLLQDRIDDVLAVLPKIKKEELAGEMLIQYDYLVAYTDLYTDYPAFKKARAICIDYLTYPIYTWRNKFIELANQMAEFDGQVEVSKIVAEDGATQKKKDAQKQAIVEASISENKVKVQSKNADFVTVNLYEVDLEVMFSQDPFLEQDSVIFTFIKPNHTSKQALPNTEDMTTTLIDIPEAFAKKNLLIQIVYKDTLKSVTYFPSTLKTLVIENLGQIKVTGQDGKPQSKVYVKCFAKATNGTTKFYKDGYTDMRGTFDYASLNLDSQKSISVFGLLVSSKDQGAIIQKVLPPSEMQKEEGAMKLKAEAWQQMQKEQEYDDIMQATEEAKPYKEAYHMKKNKYWK